jgi:hypothetical protein
MSGGADGVTDELASYLDQYKDRDGHIAGYGTGSSGSRPWISWTVDR